MALTGRSRYLPLSDAHVFAYRSNVTPFVKPLSKTGYAVAQQQPWELGGDGQMALQGAVFHDPFTDPNTNTTYAYRLYAVLGNYLNTCCHYRSLAMYVSNDGVSWVRPNLGLVEYPCGSGNKANNIVKLSGGLPFKWNGRYYVYYDSYGCGETDVWMSSANGVTNWVQEPSLMSATKMDTHYQDGAVKLITSPVDGQKRWYTRGWLDTVNPNIEIDPPTGDVGRTAVWIPLPNFPNSSPWPPAGWSRYEVNNGHGKPDLHNADFGGVIDANSIQLPLDWNGVGAVGNDVYVHAVTEFSTEVDSRMAPVFFSVNTHYDYRNCHHVASLSYSRNGSLFVGHSTHILQTGTYNVDPDGGYFFVDFGAVLTDNGTQVTHYYGAAKNGGKPGCGTPFQAGNQSIQKAAIRLDGYIPNRFYTNGEAVTQDFIIPAGEGSVLHINLGSYGASSMSVQVETPSGSVIPGFSFADCVALSGDHILDGTVHWLGHTLQSLAGQTVRFHLKGEGDVNSLWLEFDSIVVSYPNSNSLALTQGASFSTVPSVITDSSLVSAVLVSGSLPNGCALNASTGQIHGTPSSSGTGSASIKFLSKGAESTVVVSWAVTSIVIPAPSFALPSSAFGTVGQHFSLIPTNVTGSPVFTFQGLLHPGITLNPVTGELSGVPTAPGTYSVALIATNSSGSASHLVSIRVASNQSCEIPQISPNTVIGNGRVTFILSNSGVQFSSSVPGASITVVDSFQLPNGCWQYTVDIANVTQAMLVCGG